MPTRITATIDPARSLTDARTDHGHRILLDAPPPEGDDAAPGPKETLLAALAGCTGMDVVSILRKKRQRAASYAITASGESADEHPRVFTTITVEHVVSGAVQAEALRRSIELSATRYCPVNAMLSATATIEHRYRLSAEDGSVLEALVAVTGPAGSHVVPGGG
jgi:putative redox protein